MFKKRLLLVSSVLSTIFSFIIIVMTLYHNFTVKQLLKDINQNKHT
ncbi:MAG TPA: hypothetical protein VK077_11660 [Virgibacillus sp.]|nr:hypothetical protein [Virgibacillus sp.]